jgi:pimeloyl-ACP methyl ester carboxylesterase
LIPSDESFLQPDEDEPDCLDADSATSSDTDDALISDVRWDSSRKAGGPFYQMFHHTADEVRINIPTAHVYGRYDPWRMHSKDLVKLCRDEAAYVYEHDGGHEIPRDNTEDICDVIEMAVLRAIL